MPPGPVSRLLGGALAVTAMLGACGPGDPATDTAAVAAADSPAVAVGASSIRGDRYCEILLVNPGADGLAVEVYSTFPLNDCPAGQWEGLVPADIAAASGVAAAVANGPRYWAIDAVGRTTTDDVVRRDFGGLAMNRYATVVLPGAAAMAERYVVRAVDRRAVMTFAAGSEVYLLVDPAGATYAMQSWSQQADPTLTADQLAGLGSRLALPDGWRFETRTLADDLVVEFGDQPAQVVQDDLGNSYSRVTI